MRGFRTARLLLLSVTLVVLVACGSIEEQCRGKYGASELAYDQCVERRQKLINRLYVSLEQAERPARRLALALEV